LAYPMHYHRVINRNNLLGGYERSLLAGDLRRLEHDTLDAAHLAGVGRESGATEDQVQIILRKFFYDCICGMFSPIPGPDGFGRAHGWSAVESYEAPA
jgi:hypothetical protein